MLEYQVGQVAVQVQISLSSLSTHNLCHKCSCPKRCQSSSMHASEHLLSLLSWLSQKQRLFLCSFQCVRSRYPTAYVSRLIPHKRGGLKTHLMESPIFQHHLHYNRQSQTDLPSMLALLDLHNTRISPQDLWPQLPFPQQSRTKSI